MKQEMEEREQYYKSVLTSVMNKNWIYNAGNLESDQSSQEDEKQVESDIEEKVNTDNHYHKDI